MNDFWNSDEKFLGLGLVNTMIYIPLAKQTDSDSRKPKYSLEGGYLPEGIEITEGGNLIGFVDEDEFSGENQVKEYDIRVRAELGEVSDVRDYTIKVTNNELMTSSFFVMAK